MVTKQEIVDRREALNVEQGAAYRKELARIEKERVSLQELCGATGHVYATASLEYFVTSRLCCFCRAAEPKSGQGGHAV